MQDGIARADTCSPSAPSSGRTFGDITTRIDEIIAQASDLKDAYEGDVNAVGLADRAGTIRRLADGLESTLYGIDNAMSAL